jgi:3-dehydroquinate synthase
MSEAHHIQIDLPAREGGPYDLVLCHGDGPAQLAAAALRFGDRPRFIVADENVAALHGRAFRGALGDPPMFVLPPGEWAKSLAAVERVANALVEAGVRRDAVLFALGGGALCDAAGFLAASLLRGIDHVLVPTTLLAMVDAAVGGKTAVNLAAGKNLFGAFHHPRFVLCDLSTLSTLSARDQRAGMAEVLKHALLEGERAVAHLEQHADKLRDAAPGALADVVRRAITYKAKIVAHDPREKIHEKKTKKARGTRPVALDGREILNLGHTIGHALEAASHETADPLRHGEAVALGLIAEARIARTLNLWPKGPDRLAALLRRLGLPVALDDSLRAMSQDRLRRALGADKKRQAAALPTTAADTKLRLIVLDGPGRPLGVALDAERALEILLGEKVG